MENFDYSPVGKGRVNSNDTKSITLTNGQQRAVEGLIDFINSPYDKSKSVYGLVGPGGVGKTFVTRYIVQRCKLSSSTIKCCSPTHKACRVFSNAVRLKVDTIQSTFGFRLNLNIEDFDYNNPAFTPISSPKLDNVQLLICDEASMLNASLVTYIINKCTEHNIKLLFIGDSSQLAPVNEYKSTAFTKCNKVFELTEIVRQEENNPILILLDYLREDIKYKSHKFINYVSKHIGVSNYNQFGEGFSIIGAKDFSNIVSIKFNDEQYTKNIEMYKLIAYTNVAVTSWNNFIRNLIITDANKNIITTNDLIMSYETTVDEFNDIILNNSEEYIIKDLMNYVEPKYDFKGFLVKFQKVNGGNITKPIFIIDHRDKYTILKYIETIQNLISEAKKATGGVRANRWKAYYDFKKQYLIMTNIKKGDQILYSRDIDYAFAITAHKS